MSPRHRGALTAKEKKDIGERLRLVRDALGLTLIQFYEPVGISSSQASAIELYGKGLGVGKALDLQDKWRISLDWIYGGDIRTLTVDMGDAIRALQHVRADGQHTAEPAAVAKPRRGRPPLERGHHRPRDN